MSGSVNKVILIGHLGADPEVRSLQGGGKVATLRIATGESWTDKASGQRKERTEWHTVVIFGPGGSGAGAGLAGIAEKYLRKGSRVYVEGCLRTRKWQHKDGSDRWSTEVVCQGFGAKLLLLDRSEGAGPGRHDYSSYSDGPGAGGASSSGSFADDLNDDVPF